MKWWHKAAIAVAFLFVFAYPVVTHATIGDKWQIAQATPAAPAATQNTITTTAPVTSETTISVGTLAGQVLNWMAVVFGVPIGTLLSAWLWRLFTSAGLTIGDQARARLQQMVINGLNASAKAAEGALEGRGKIVVKNQVIAGAVTYVQQHGADTLKQLGVDPYSNIAVDAIKARIETAIADPMTPTPAVLDPVKAPVPPPVNPQTK